MMEITPAMVDMIFSVDDEMVKLSQQMLSTDTEFRYRTENGQVLNITFDKYRKVYYVTEEWYNVNRYNHIRSEIRKLTILDELVKNSNQRDDIRGDK